MIYKNYINGKWISSQKNENFDSLNPATEISLGKFQKSSKEDVKHAIDAAETSFCKWSSLPAPSRGRYLLRIANLLRQDKERLSRIMTMEMGKVIKESRGD